MTWELLLVAFACDALGARPTMGMMGDGASGYLDGRAHNPEANPRAELAGRQPCYTCVSHNSLQHLVAPD